MEKRRFLLSDLMILVAAVALCVAWSSTLVRLDYPLFMGRSLEEDPPEYIYEGLLLACPSVSILSLVALILRIRKPRPRRTRLTRQPGFVASVIASPFLVLIAINVIVLWWRDSKYNPGNMLFSLYVTHQQIGLSIIGAWICLWMTSAWRAESSWTDRLGRAIGCYWVAIVVAEKARYFF